MSMHLSTRKSVTLLLLLIFAVTIPLSAQQKPDCTVTRDAAAGERRLSICSGRSGDTRRTGASLDAEEGD